MEYPNPDKFIFNKNVSKGFIYKNAYPNIKGDAVICLDGVNLELFGKVKIVLREGKSKFGEQIIFQFLIEKVKQKYKANSKHSLLEFYLPKEEGLRFLTKTANFFNEQTQELEAREYPKL